MKQTLYKKSRSGKIQEWTIETEGPKFRTSEGYVNGAITTTAWTEVKGKSIGKANETSPEQQAVKEAEARVTKQLDKGWTPDVDKVEEAKVAISPMLAEKYEDYKEHILSHAVACQPKLDGIRCIGTMEGLFTRKGKKIVAAPHIERAVQIILEGCPPGTKLDGELYNHEFKQDFNEIASIVRKQKVTEEDIQKAADKLQYHVYDIDMPGQFASRSAALNALVQQYSNCRSIILVKTVFCIGTAMNPFSRHPEVDHWYDIWLEQGYEGQMLRSSLSKYQNHRTKDLLKRKEWIDGEFLLQDILPGKGNRAHVASSVICIDERNEVFDAGVLGNFAYCENLLKNKKKYIGKMVTIKYQNLTPDRQVPRFAKMKAVRDYE